MGHGAYRWCYHGSVASNGGFPNYYDGRGGIAQWDIANDTWGANIEPTGQVDRVTAYETNSGEMWVSWGELRLDLYDASGNFVGSWNSDDGLDFPSRDIVEYNGDVLFATEDGVARYDRSTNSWLSTWQENNGLPGNSGSEFYELWTNGVDLVLGGGDGQSFQGFQGAQYPIGMVLTGMYTPKVAKVVSSEVIRLLWPIVEDYSMLEYMIQTEVSSRLTSPPIL